MTRLFAMRAAGADFSAPEWRGYLSEKRLTEAEKMHSEKARRLFLGAEALLNRSLEKLGIGTIPAAYEKNAHGKPYLTDCPNIYVNWSHSGEYVLLGISDVEIGVDLQYNRKEPKESLIRRTLNPQELAYFQNVSETEQRACFYEFWTLKESFLKALGTGFATPLEDFTIQMGDDGQPKILQRVNTKPYGCALVDFPDRDYTAAYCREGPAEHIEIEYN